MNWIKLSNKSQIDALKNDNQALIFKHSTRCPVSMMAKRSFESEYQNNENVNAYFLDLIAFREVSNYISTEFGVEHESPQLLLIKNGECILDTSHGAIEASLVEENFKS